MKWSDSQHTDLDARSGATVNTRTWRHEMERQSIHGPGGKKWSDNKYTDLKARNGATINKRTWRQEMEQDSQYTDREA